MKKKCSRCKKSFPSSGFHRNRSRRDGHDDYCKSCRREASAEYNKDHPLVVRRSRERYYNKNLDKIKAKSRSKYDATTGRDLRLKRAYGISLATYDKILASQNNTCAICGATPNGRRLAVDHDHRTGKIRGLLCVGCNRGIGYFKDSPKLLLLASRYLQSQNA